MRAQLSFIYTSVIISAAFLVGCEVNLPIKEMADAKTAITQARYYQADTYAPEEIKAADDALILTHDMIKNEKEKEAIAAAVDAKAKATAALEKALPLLANETIVDAKKIIAEAKGLYSDEAAAEDTVTAERLITDADKSYNEKMWIPAYENAVKARVAAALARDKALARIPALRSRLDELKAERDSLKNQNAAAYAPSELASLDAELTKAETSLAGNSIKEAVTAINTSSDLVDKINLLGKSALAREKITRAESSITQIKASPYAADVAAKTAEAETKTADAKTALTGGNPDDASSSADEALGIIDAILIELAKKDEEAKNVASMKKDTETAATADATKSAADTIVSEVEDTIHYIVQWRKRKTDCLWRIAEKLYRNARLWPVIYMANRDKIKDPDLIYPGQKLVIPPAPKKRKAWELDKPIPIPQPEPAEPSESGKDDAAVKPDQPAVEKDVPADKAETAPSDDTSENAVEAAKPTGDTEPPAEDAVDQPSDDTSGSSGDTADETGNDAPADDPDETTPPADESSPAENDSSHNDYNRDAALLIAVSEISGQSK